MQSYINVHLSFAFFSKCSMWARWNLIDFFKYLHIPKKIISYWTYEFNHRLLDNGLKLTVPSQLPHIWPMCVYTIGRVSRNTSYVREEHLQQNDSQKNCVTCNECRNKFVIFHLYLFENCNLRVNHRFGTMWLQSNIFSTVL